MKGMKWDWTGILKEMRMKRESARLQIVHISFEIFNFCVPHIFRPLIRHIIIDDVVNSFQTHPTNAP